MRMPEPFSRHIVIVLALLMLGVPWYAEASSEKGALPVDTSEVTVRTPDSSLLASYREDPAYVYERRGEGLSWWDRFQAWILDRFRASMDVPGVPILAHIMAVLALAGVLLLALHWLRQTRSTPPIRSHSSLSTESTVTRETLETADFATEAKRAASEGAYRQAVRYQYLWLLQGLVREDHVHWTPDKTNDDLVDETQGMALHDDFARATELFEVVWYGGASLDRRTFERVRVVIEAARQHVDPNPAPTSAS